MQSKTMDRAALDNCDYEVMEVPMEGRENPYYIFEQTTLEKDSVNTVLNRLGHVNYIVQVMRGLYKISGRNGEKAANRKREQ